MEAIRLMIMKCRSPGVETFHDKTQIPRYNDSRITDW
jgi:hypothetical protein